MDILYPRIAPREWGRILALAAQGALIAGLYGIAHDQITYTISPEYYTEFKFEQFRYADLGWPLRWHVAEIGFLATWWVGLFSGWFLARSGVRRFPREQLAFRVRRAFVCVFLSALLSGAVAGLVGYFTLHGKTLEAWNGWAAVRDLRRFAIVGYIHDGGYLGGLIGLVLGVLYLRRAAPAATPSSPSPAGGRGGGGAASCG